MIKAGKKIDKNNTTINNKEKTSSKERFKPEFKVADFYSYFRKHNLKLSISINEVTYNAIIKEYNKLLTKDILEGKIIKIDSDLGHIGIIECERNLLKKNKEGIEKPRLIPDWGKTRKLNIINPVNGKLVVQYFEDQKYYYKIKWFKYSTITNIKLTSFEPCKDFRRSISKKLIANSLINLQYRLNNDKKKRVFDTPLANDERTTYYEKNKVPVFNKLIKDSDDI